MAKKFYITTPIYYVNDLPHIGHASTTVVADVLTRYHQLLGEKTFFLTGTDEHGSTVAEAAKKAGQPPKKFVDGITKKYQEAWPKLNIEYDYFIRTTNPKHEKLVQNFINKIYQKDDIYKGKYEGLYCVGCEKYLTESDLVEGKCPLHPNRKPEKQSEENYFFKLKKYQKILIKALEDKNDPNHYEIYPPERYNEVISTLKKGLNDTSISRAKVEWGIPLPWDKKQTIYVWLDALLNYHTALKITDNEWAWPPEVHVIAKDILWFHCIFWQALLIAASVKLPKQIFVHSYYTIDGQKMSKSVGNIISVDDLVKRYGADGARYLILASFPTLSDGDVGYSKFNIKYNADLANGLGNLVARVAKLCEKSNFKFSKQKLNFKQIQAVEKINKSLKEFKFNEALAIVWGKISKADKYVNTHQSWALKGKKLEKTLNHLVREVREIAILITPFLPKTAEKIEKQFQGPKIKSEKPLFPRIK